MPPSAWKKKLRYQHNVVEVDDLPRAFESRFHPFLRLLWCEGSDLLSGESLLVPYEMVHTNYAVPLPDGHGCFAASSNGLASGNTLIEAISQESAKSSNGTLRAGGSV